MLFRSELPFGLLDTIPMLGLALFGGLGFGLMSSQLTSAPLVMLVAGLGVLGVLLMRQLVGVMTRLGGRPRFFALLVALAAAPLGQAAKKKADTETLVAQLFGSLNDSQKKVVAFPFEHPLREKVDNNWHITKKSIGEIFTGEQQALVKEIFLKLHSEQYAETVLGQVRHDSGDEGFESTSVALFGQPNTGKFEFVLTGRHCTRRCDGDSVEGEAFGGPIFYGHAARAFNEAPDHPGNVYWYQAKQANKVFAMMDGEQRKMALLGKSRGEQGTKTVALSGKKHGLPGIPVSELSSDQKGQVRKTMADLLAMFREKDAKEALKMVDAGGFDHLHLAFYKNHDVGNDKIWDVWQIEGPNCLWFFRGDPHVHAWVNIKSPV